MTDIPEEPGVSRTTPVPDDRRKRKRRPKAGDIQALRRILWETTLEVEKLVQAPNPDQTLKAASTIATLSGVYLKALETADLEARLSALEKAQKGKGATHDD